MATDDDGTTNRTPETKPMMLQPARTTERSTRRTRLDRHTAALVRKMDEIPPGTRVLIIVDVKPDGRRIWSLAPVIAEAGT